MQTIEYFNGELGRYYDSIGYGTGKKQRGEGAFEIKKILSLHKSRLDELFEILANEYGVMSEDIRKMSMSEFLLKYKDFTKRIKTRIDNAQKWQTNKKT